ncbi:MAG: hypothetical protein K8E24_000165 [Methanobacterium paludis]|nr:hypothetical protein [Methanobacterium paludis]
MKLAIITITPKAQKLAEKIMDELAEDPTVIKIDIFEKNVKKTLKKVFNSYNCIIGIMATGIMVRNICGLIKNKTEDPAVLVVDENGEHVISLLSGHLGGGNDFTLKMADIIGAKPIITTSTDRSGMGQGIASSASVGAVVEDKSMFAQGMVFTAIPETHYTMH